MREMIRAFEKAGHEVVPIIMGGIEEPIKGANKTDTSRRLKKLVKRLFPGFVWESAKHVVLLLKDRQYKTILNKKVIEDAPDLIYERASFLQLSGLHVARKHGIKHVLEVNTPAGIEREALGTPYSLFSRLAHTNEKKQLEWTDKIVVVSSALKNFLVKKYGLPEAKLICCPNGINQDTIVIDQNVVLEIKRKYGIANQFVVGFVGSIIKWHRVDLLIEACRLLHRENRNIVVLIIGDSDLVPALKRLSSELGVENRVIFVGRVPHSEVFNYVEAMDVVVLPDNLWYGSPTKVFEYGAMKKAVIAPDNETLREIITHGEEGFLVTPNSEHLSNEIKRLMEDTVLRENVAELFHEKVKSQFTWSRNADQIIEAVG